MCGFISNPSAILHKVEICGSFIPFSARAKEVFNLACTYANHKQVEPKHLFKAILFYKNQNDEAIKILDNLGANFSKFEEIL
ncbi:hypothetical protein IJS77_03520 [bacterium]|nr:hypothetical protein [bacterium]